MKSDWSPFSGISEFATQTGGSNRPGRSSVIPQWRRDFHRDVHGDVIVTSWWNLGPETLNRSIRSSRTEEDVTAIRLRSVGTMSTSVARR